MKCWFNCGREIWIIERCLGEIRFVFYHLMYFSDSHLALSLLGFFFLDEHYLSWELELGQCFPSCCWLYAVIKWASVHSGELTQRSSGYLHEREEEMSMCGRMLHSISTFNLQFWSEDRINFASFMQKVFIKTGFLICKEVKFVKETIFKHKPLSKCL